MFQGNIGRLLSSTMTESQVGDEFWKGISDERILRLLGCGGCFCSDGFLTAVGE